MISLIVSHLVEKCFLGRSSAGSPAGSGRTAPATWSTPRRGACSVPRDHPTPAPDSPARRRAAEVKMVGYITVAHGAAQRLSEKWRHFACTSDIITFCTSLLCVGVKATTFTVRGSVRSWDKQFCPLCAVQLHAMSAAARYELESESEWSAVFCRRFCDDR